MTFPLSNPLHDPIFSRIMPVAFYDTNVYGDTVLEVMEKADAAIAEEFGDNYTDDFEIQVKITDKHSQNTGGALGAKYYGYVQAKRKGSW